MTYMNEISPETICVQGSGDRDDKYGAISSPVYFSATYAHPALGQDAEKILAGEMKPKGHPGNPEFAVEMEGQEFLDFRCKEADVRDEQGVVSALVY